MLIFISYEQSAPNDPSLDPQTANVPSRTSAKRVAMESSTFSTYVYSLPGAGKTATGNEIVQDAPRRGRKYIQDAHVLVEENNQTYNMNGLRVQ